MREPLPAQPEEERVLDLYQEILKDCPEDDDAFARYVAQRSLKHPALWQTWIDNSGADLFYWKVCQELVAAHSPMELVPTPLLNWVYEVALGRCREPKRRGRPPDMWARNIVIAQLVSLIVSFGYRDATSSNEGGSACHLVAARMDIDYDAVRGIWKRERIV